MTTLNPVCGSSPDAPPGSMVPGKTSLWPPGSLLARSPALCTPAAPILSPAKTRASDRGRLPPTPPQAPHTACATFHMLSLPPDPRPLSGCLHAPPHQSHLLSSHGVVDSAPGQPSDLPVLVTTSRNAFTPPPPPSAQLGAWTLGPASWSRTEPGTLYRDTPHTHTLQPLLVTRWPGDNGLPLRVLGRAEQHPVTSQSGPEKPWGQWQRNPSTRSSHRPPRQGLLAHSSSCSSQCRPPKPRGHTHW